MSDFVKWSSQPLDDWALKYAQGQFLEVEGHSIHYIKEGEGPPLILLHGFIFDQHLWMKNLHALAVNHTVYAMDLWGFGYSSRTKMDHGYSLYARQLEGFMNALGIEKASMMGQSMGAGTIMKFAADHAERVEKMVLVNAAGLPNKLPLIGRISLLPGIGELMVNTSNNANRKFILKNSFLYRKEVIDEVFEVITRFHKVKGTSEIMLKILRKQFFDTLEDEILKIAGFHIPALIIWGRYDHSIDWTIGEQLHNILEGSQFEVLEKAGHCANLDQPEAFNKLAVNFLAT